MSTYDIFKQTKAHPTNALLLIEFIAQEEFSAPARQFEDARDIAWVNDEIRKGNNAAWFSAKVYIRAAGTDVCGTPQYLGCCSYRSFDEFLDCGYFRDMVKDATDAFFNTLPTEIQKARSTLQVLEQLKLTGNKRS